MEPLVLEGIPRDMCVVVIPKSLFKPALVFDTARDIPGAIVIGDALAPNKCVGIVADVDHAALQAYAIQNVPLTDLIAPRAMPLPEPPPTYPILDITEPDFPKPERVLPRLTREGRRGRR